MYMEIKNTEELVQRAKDHLAADHFAQEFYVQFTGEDITGDFKGCEIGCLAMPVKEATRAEVVKQLLEAIKGDYRRDPEPDDINDHSQRLVKMNEDTFGICSMLQRLAESFFERLPKDQAGQFVVEFTESLPEGANISDQDVLDWCNERNRIYEETHDTEDSRIFESKAWYAEIHDDYGGVEGGSGQDIDAEKESFLAWLEAKAPRPFTLDPLTVDEAEELLTRNL